MRTASLSFSSCFAWILGLALQAGLTPGATAATPAASSSRTTAANPLSVVLVHGAWADASSWNAVIPLLEAQGLKVVAVQAPLTSLADDVGAVRRAIERQGGPVLLVGHSWGGVIITEAGRHPSVAGLVYVAAFAPGEGESVEDLAGDKSAPPPPGLAGLVPDAEGFLWQTPDNVAKNFAQDIPAAQARLIAVTQKPINSKSFGTKVGVPAWGAKPDWFLVAERDRMIPTEAQRAFAARMKAKTSTVASGHNPMLSQPASVATVIVDAARQLSR
jgi:pimeloyl-ACP methyl ester carboxylesterase